MMTNQMQMRRTVRDKMVVCGQTFGAHLQLLEKIQTSRLNLMKGNDEESCITIVFCPVGSQPRTDAEAAMRTVPGFVSWSIDRIVCYLLIILVTMKYEMVVCGETFGAHLQLLDQIQTSGLNLIEINDEESCITFLFCPVTSRIGTDAEAAMKNVKGGDPVILVFMHYSQERRDISSSEVFSSLSDVFSEVHVFYDRKNGLLSCEQNEKAVNELKEKLMKLHRQSCSCAIL
ncbi:uncharacterized protein LOC112157845 [Oryzias melastigma]|uniref:uncharacterized protein LOC112157845 n=1 Tax=Oryzias melastigma TaxID=30732 RepID=UPI000CF7F48C|nr:uncharacterized protein LOC112157845 [Oryzias melastigma]